jgi:acetyltransferase-like isoleucine patch superfamily enzyme
MKKSLKYFFKNILPYGIVIAIRKKFKANPKDYSCFFEKFGNSVLLSNFKIWSLHSLSKNVRIGDECMLYCTILFEALSGQVIIGNNTYIGNSTIICKSKIQFDKITDINTGKIKLNTPLSNPINDLNVDVTIHDVITPSEFKTFDEFYNHVVEVYSKEFNENNKHV